MGLNAALAPASGNAFLQLLGAQEPHFRYDGTMPSKLRVLLVDDQPVARVGLRLLLDRSPDFEVCGEAANVLAAHRFTESHQPDCIVLDLVLGGRDGVEMIEDLLVAHPAARILVFSSLDEMVYARRALRAGARGYVEKSRELEEVGIALARIAAGDFAFSARVSRAIFASSSPGSFPEPFEQLSNRELQIFRLLGEGRSTADIAAELSLSIKTVGTYRERLKNKLGLHSAQSLEQSAARYLQEGSLARPRAS